MTRTEREVIVAGRQDGAAGAGTGPRAGPGPPMNAVAVTGGMVVTPDGVRPGDVFISDGKIAAIIGAAGSTARRVQDAARLDAEGCYVLPGGVDPHCYLAAESAQAAGG
jgi:imidazolonepropionase-like amidohydrolase